MASVSAAVTVFGRQAGDVCLCDTDKIYLAADSTMQHVLQGTVAQAGVTESQKQPVSIFNSHKLYLQDHCQDIFDNTQLKNQSIMHHMFIFR